MYKLSKALDIYLTVRNLKQQFLDNCSRSLREISYLSNAFVWQDTSEGVVFWSKENKLFDKLQIIDLDTLFIPDTRIVCDTYEEVIELFRFLHLLKLTWASGDNYTNKYELKIIKTLYDNSNKCVFCTSEGYRGLYIYTNSQDLTYINYKDIIIPK